MVADQLCRIAASGGKMRGVGAEVDGGQIKDLRHGGGAFDDGRKMRVIMRPEASRLSQVLHAVQRRGELVIITFADPIEAKKRAYVLADNKLAEQAGWDRDLLALEAAELHELGVDLGGLGFAAGEIDALLTHGAVDPREEETPPVPAVAVSRPGDLWCLGAHRLICGDATDPETVARVLGDVRPQLMVTDPPYGVDYDPAWRNAVGAAKTKRTGKVLNDDRADWREAWALFPGDVAYVWHGALHSTTVAESLSACEFDLRAQIIWAKERLVLSRGDYHWQHEPCWYAVRAKGKGHWVGDRKQTTLWSIPSRDQDAATVHGTQKPVECLRRPMLNNSSPGQAVYEPFMGSGTTLIAAETCGRVCYAIELDPAYVDVAVLRWQVFTGRTAVLAGTGETFAAVAAEREVVP